ncbi:MAG: FAD-binding protein [Pseudomonadota bacterium]|nr:FAD-binding protein [Pseudomonadota bacterium]
MVEAAPQRGFPALAESPLSIAGCDALRWDDEADVVVVGFGGAGAVAAIQAAEGGASVIIADRFDGGGATTLSGGVIYSGANDVQRAAGIADSVEDMFEYLKLEVKGVVSDDALYRYCADSQTNIDWLRKQGVGYRSEFRDGRFAFPPEDVFIYYTGNEKLPHAVAKAKPAPRGLRAAGKGLGGRHFYGALRATALRSGAKYYPQSPATRLIVSADGAVLGVELRRLTPGTKPCARHAKLKRRYDALLRFIGGSAAAKAAAEMMRLEQEHGVPLRLRARSGVILAAGGFIFNPDMVQRHTPRYVKSMPLGTVSCDGSGIQLGMSVGAATGQMDHVAAWRHLAMPAAPEAYLKGLLVNARGERFIPEDAYSATVGGAIAESHDGRAWLIQDKPLRRQSFGALWGQLRSSMVLTIPTLLTLLFGTKRGKTIEELAVAVGVDPVGLRATVDANNATLAAGKPDPFGKQPEYRRPISSAPYYAIYVGTDSTFSQAVTVTLGGLVVDEGSGLVKRHDGRTIAGLYAVGRTAVGIPSENYVSGLSIGDCVFSGRRAALHATSSKRSQRVDQVSAVPTEAIVNE